MRAAAIAKLRQKQKPTANSEGGTSAHLQISFLMLVRDKVSSSNGVWRLPVDVVFAGRWSVKHGTEGSGCVAKGSGPRVVNDIKQEEVGRGGAVQGTRLGWRTKGRVKP